MDPSDVLIPEIAAIVCPSCGEVYDALEGAPRVLGNAGFCVNLTCLQDLNEEPFRKALFTRRTERRRAM